MASLYLADFSGGINYRDSPNQLALNEAQDATNFTLDERGALKRRNGIFNVGTLPGVSGKDAYIFWSEALGLFLCARETAHAPNTMCVHTSTTGGTGTWTDRGVINSDVTAQVSFIDFPLAAAGGPKVVIVSDKNGGATKGVFTLDGAFALANPSTTTAGTAIFLWQNKAWVLGYPTSDANGNPTTLRWCDAGDPATWTATNIQQFRDKDASPLTGGGVVGGALVVFKKRSAYRVTDSSTGAFTTIDPQNGTVNARSTATTRGRLYTWGADGMYECDGVGALRNVGDKIRTVYNDANTNTTTIVAGVYQDHVMFAGVAPSSRLIYEYDPGQGWIMRHQIASSSQDQLTSMTTKDGVLYAAAVDGDDLLRMFTETPGTDDATTSLASWTSPFLLPNSGMLARVSRVRVQGLIGTGTSATLLLSIFKNWDYTAGFDQFNLTAALLAPDASHKQLVAEVMSLGHAASFQLEFDVATAAGAVSIRSMQLIDTALQYPNPGYPRYGKSTPVAPSPLPPPAQ